MTVTLRDVADIDTLLIRAPEPAELATAGQVTLAAYRAAGMAGQGYAAELADAARRHREAELLVAVDAEGTVCGTVTFCPPGSSWQEIARKGEGELRMLAVAPDAQGRGIGRALTLACLDRAGALGLRGIVLSTPTANTRAHRLYESLGFVRDPERDWTPVPEVSLLAYVRLIA